MGKDQLVSRDQTIEVDSFDMRYDDGSFTNIVKKNLSPLNQMRDNSSYSIGYKFDHVRRPPLKAFLLSSDSMLTYVGYRLLAAHLSGRNSLIQATVLKTLLRLIKTVSLP